VFSCSALAPLRSRRVIYSHWIPGHARIGSSSAKFSPKEARPPSYRESC
jgi:hypothetical protein